MTDDRDRDYKRRTRIEFIIKIGRTHKDFLDYITLNPSASIVEMDTVEGVKDRKYEFKRLFEVILTDNESEFLILSA